MRDDSRMSCRRDISRRTHPECPDRLWVLGNSLYESGVRLVGPVIRPEGRVFAGRTGHTGRAIGVGRIGGMCESQRRDDFRGRATVQGEHE